LSDFQFRYTLSKFDNLTDDLVTGDYVLASHRELTFDYMQVSTTNATRAHANEHLIIGGRRNLNFDNFERPSRNGCWGF
jgi:hypothetical protein